MPDWSLVYHVKAFEILRDLETAGRHLETMTYHELATVFEYWSALQLSTTMGRQFFMYNDVPPDFKETTDLPLKDCGVDLCNMQDAIVQCKLRTGSLTWRDVATFFGSQNRFNAATGRRDLVQWPQLVITRNAESKLAPALQPMMQGVQDVVVSDADFRKWCASLLAQKPCLPPYVVPTFHLREYQYEATGCIRQGRDAQRNVVISLPTGTGKNVVMLYSMDFDKEATSYLVLVPRIILMEQLHDVALAHFPQLRGRIQCIGGDANHHFQSGMRLTVCVFNSVHHVAPHAASFSRTYVDEAHHIRSPEVYTIEGDSHEGVEFSSEEDDEDDSEEKQTTGTSHIRAIWEMHSRQNNVYLSATIDSDALPDAVFFKKDIRDMIDAGVIADYEIRVPIFSQVPNDENVARYLLDNDRSILIFCSSQASGEAFTVTLNRLQPGSAGYIDSRTPRRERIVLLQKFNDGLLPFLVNVEVLVEGFDAPATRGVCFLHMPQSHVKIVQVVGRALRLHPLKSIARIYLPCTTEDDGTSAEHVLRTLARNDSRIRASFVAKKQGGYIGIVKVGSEGTGVDPSVGDAAQHLHDMVYNSLGHLTNSDELWAAKWAEVQQFYETHGEWPTLRTSVTLGHWINNQNTLRLHNRLGHVRTERLEAHPRWQWRKDLATKWQEMWCFVQQFYSMHGKWCVAQSNDADEKKAGMWITNQRKRKKQGKLSQHRIDTLQAHPQWFWDLDAQWHDLWVQAQKYFTEHGRWPPMHSKTGLDGKLARWISQQRVKRQQLSDKRVKALEAHPHWVWSDGMDWQQNWTASQQHYSEHGRWPSGGWVAKQRATKKRGKLSQERIDALQAHPHWYWEVNLDEQWQENWSTLQQFYAEHGQWPSTRTTQGHWISTQRTLKKQGKLSQERIDTLESHPSWTWDGRKRDFDEMNE